MYTSHPLYPSSVDGHLGCFHVLTIVNSAAMNIRVHIASQVKSFYLLFLIVFVHLPVRGLHLKIVSRAWRSLF